MFMDKEIINKYFDAHANTLLDRYRSLKYMINKIQEQVDNDLQILESSIKLIKERDK